MKAPKTKTLTTIISCAVDEKTKQQLDEAAFVCGGASRVLRYGLRLALEAIESGKYFDDMKKLRDQKE